jgi:hypothetical protein
MVDAFAEGFVGDDLDKESADKVLNQYQYNVYQHILEHYEIYTNTHRRQAITSHQLLYYHVYGDYRLKLVRNETDGRWTPRFVYRTYTYTEREPSLNVLADNRDGREQFFLNSYLRSEIDEVGNRRERDFEKDGHISGLFKEVSSDGGLLHDFGNVGWLNTEMNKQGTGTLFNLPSLGTEIIKLHSYGNASDNIKKSLKKEINALVDFYEEKSQPIVFYDEFIYDEDDELIGSEVLDLINMRATPSQRLSLDQLNPDVSHLAAVFVSAVLTNREYIELRDTAGVGGLLPGESTILNTLRRVYHIDHEYDNYSANNAIVEALFAKSGQSFYVGDRVRIASSNTVLDQIAEQFELSEGEADNRDQVRDSSYIVTGFVSDSVTDSANGYTLEEVDLTAGTNEELFSDQDAGELLMFKASSLMKEEVLDLAGSGDIEIAGKLPGQKGKKKKKGGKVVIPPALIVLQRIIMDTFCAIQILIKLSEEYHDTEARGEAKIRYLSRGVNTYSVTSLNQKEGKKKKDKKKINARDVYLTFPNMTTFNREAIGNKVPESKVKIGNVGLLDNFTKWRTYYTLSILAQIRKKTIERQHMDDFFSNNILVKEVEWLSAALGDGAKVLRKKEDPVDLLTQVQYTYVKGIPAHTSPPLSKGHSLIGHPLVQQTADAPKTTVFYEVDMPLLKEVIGTYTDVYNDTTIARAFNTESKIVEKRVPGVLANEEVIEVLRDAKQAKTDGDNDRKGMLVERAIRMQPDAFSVDEPFGKNNTEPPGDSFPGVTYRPTGHRFQFHVKKIHIPEDIAGADRISSVDNHGKVERLGEAIDPLGGAYAEDSRETPPGPSDDEPIGAAWSEPRDTGHQLWVKQQTKPPQKGQLAKFIWQSIGDRGKSVFDKEGIEPHEFMNHLFNKMDAALERSNLIKSPYPEAWLGANTVDKLRTDPTKLGEVLENRFYAEKLNEYVESLSKKYMNNYMIPKVLITAIEQAEIKYVKDPEILKTAFMERLAKDADRPILVTTDYVLRPYGITIAIMRGILDISQSERDHYVAGEIDETMREDIRRHMYHGMITPILPEEHPMYEKPPPIKSDTEEPEEPEVPPEVPVDRIADGIERLAAVIERAERAELGGFDEVEEDEEVEEVHEEALHEPAPEVEAAEEMPPPPEMEVDQLDANWAEINPVIPAADDIEEFEEVGNPADNPKGKFVQGWMYQDVEHRSGDGQLRVKMDDGEIVQYKFHIALDPSDYMKRTRDIVSTFLNRNKIHYKCGGSKGNQSWITPGSTQYGKMFTLYVKNHKEAITVAKGMVLLAAKHNLKGLVFQPDDDSNLTYERIVPGTNNTLYYAVEDASPGAIIKAGLKAKYIEIHEGRTWRMTNTKDNNRKVQPMLRFLKEKQVERIGWTDSTGGDPYTYEKRTGKEIPKLLYLNSDVGYEYRKMIMDYYWGQGPIDGETVWTGRAVDDKPPSKPPPEPASEPPSKQIKKDIWASESETRQGFFEYAKASNLGTAEIMVDEEGNAQFSLGGKEIVMTKNDPINWNLSAYNPGISREENEKKARKAGAPFPRCKKCGDYHDRRLECPIKIKVQKQQKRRRQQQQPARQRQRVRNPGGVEDEW